MTRRTERIAEQLRAEIARVLREEVSDPRIRLVTLTRVDVSPDLTLAQIYWSSVAAKGEVDLKSIESGLESALGFVRREIAQSLDWKRVPQLVFRYDSSLQSGSEILALLRRLNDAE